MPDIVECIDVGAYTCIQDWVRGTEDGVGMTAVSRAELSSARVGWLGTASTAWSHCEGSWLTL